MEGKAVNIYDSKKRRMKNNSADVEAGSSHDGRCSEITPATKTTKLRVILEVGMAVGCRLPFDVCPPARLHFPQEALLTKCSNINGRHSLSNQIR